MKRKLNFSKMTKPQRALAIAKDVLLLIRSTKYFVSKGIYFEADVKDSRAPEVDVDYKKSSLSKELPYLRSCTVCAKGAMFVSKCRINGDEEVNISWSGDITPNKNISALIRRDIGRHQADLIEAAFEQTSSLSWFYYSPGLEKAATFGEHYDENTDRLRAIMKNIIKNKGKFKP